MNIVIKQLCRFDLTKGQIGAIIVIDLLLCVVVGLDWPGAVYDDYIFVPALLYYIGRDLLYGYTVLFCVLTGMMYLRTTQGARNPDRIQSRWLTAMTLMSLFAGLAPLYAVNQYHFFRIGVPGFILPFIMLLTVFAIDRLCTPERSRRKQLLGITLSLFTIDIIVTLSVRLLLYFIRL